MSTVPMTRQQSLDVLAEALENLLRTGNTKGFATHLPEGLHPDAHTVICNVGHFLADADLRAKEADYRLMQETELKSLIVALRRGDPLTLLMEHTFLGH